MNTICVEIPLLDRRIFTGRASAGSGSASGVRGARWGSASSGVPARGGGGDARGVIAVAGGAADAVTGIEPVRGGAADTQMGVVPATVGGRRPEGGLLYTSDAVDNLLCVDVAVSRTVTNTTTHKNTYT